MSTVEYPARAYKDLKRQQLLETAYILEEQRDKALERTAYWQRQYNEASERASAATEAAFEAGRAAYAAEIAGKLRAIDWDLRNKPLTVGLAGLSDLLAGVPVAAAEQAEIEYGVEVDGKIWPAWRAAGQMPTHQRTVLASWVPVAADEPAETPGRAAWTFNFPYRTDMPDDTAEYEGDGTSPGDAGTGPDETTCKRCGRLAIDHGDSKQRAYGVCPSGAAQEGSSE